LRRASAFDLRAFFSFDQWLLGVNASHPELRVAVLSDRSPACAALFGLVQLAAPRIVHAHHAEVEALLAEAKAPPGLLAHLDDVVSTLQGSREQLRGVLRESLGRVTLSAAAKRVGRSVRALQRELERAGTTFERERAGIRRQVFESVVSDLTLKLDAIASQLGFSSLREFSTAFRRTVGVSPRSYREKVSSASPASVPPPRTSA
jgi:AraC-like DNA-binding protein